MEESLTPLWPLIVYGAAALAVVTAMLTVSALLGQRHRESATHEIYESGIISTGSARVRFDAGGHPLRVLPAGPHAARFEEHVVRHCLELLVAGRLRRPEVVVLRRPPRHRRQTQHGQTQSPSHRPSPPGPSPPRPPSPHRPDHPRFPLEQVAGAAVVPGAADYGMGPTKTGGDGVE